MKGDEWMNNSEKTGESEHLREAKRRCSCCKRENKWRFVFLIQKIREHKNDPRERE
jgi:hypothetical protein